MCILLHTVLLAFCDGFLNIGAYNNYAPVRFALAFSRFLVYNSCTNT